MPADPHVCRTCAWWGELADAKGTGECHQACPPPILIGNAGPARLAAQWPVTKAADWCGQWKQRTP